MENTELLKILRALVAFARSRSRELKRDAARASRKRLPPNSNVEIARDHVEYVIRQSAFLTAAIEGSSGTLRRICYFDWNGAARLRPEDCCRKVGYEGVPEAILLNGKLYKLVERQ